MPSLRGFLSGAMLLALPLVCARAQGVEGGNLLGGFERLVRTTDNVWDGVDSDGNLAVPTYSARALTENQRLGSLSMPPSVAAMDLNGDGKVDLLVASPTGYYFYYQNHGTPAEPKFTNAEVLPLWLSTSADAKDSYRFTKNERDDDRFCPRIAAADWRKRGVIDLLVGNLFGEMMFVPNTGTARQPVYAEPMPLERALVPTDDHNRIWANFLAPAAADWNGDGRLDAIVGEGTYSANAIHLLENIGTDVPKFSDSRHTRIAFGDGREQLIPAVVDFNGDGIPDLLVADRTGEIGVYLGAGPPKPGVELKRALTLTFGGRSRLPGLVAPTVADLNGDGLFDIVMGLPDGRIAYAINTGTKTQPAFGAWQEFKGEDRLKRDVRIPTEWELAASENLGNALAYWRVVNAQEDPASAPPDGASCLKAGYWPPATGGIFQFPDSGIPGAAHHFMLVRRVKLQVNKSYQLSFQVKGVGVDKTQWSFRHYEDAFTGSLKLDRGERGEGIRSGSHVHEEVKVGDDFLVGSNWSQIDKTFSVHFQDPGLKDVTEMNGHFVLDFYAKSLSSVLYLDNMQLTAQ